MINIELSKKIFEYIITKKVNAIVISDYDKGITEETLIKNIINAKQQTTARVIPKSIWTFMCISILPLMLLDDSSLDPGTPR
jgi:hypothetical protein